MAETQNDVLQALGSSLRISDDATYDDVRSAADGVDKWRLYTQVIAYCESEEEFNTQMDALHADLITYNQLYDIYNDYPGVRCV